jgi:hypothetical protein
MARRKLRIVKISPDFLGVCEKCGSQFGSDLPDRIEAEIVIAAVFHRHKCLRTDSSQRAMRAIREATESK